MAPFFSMLDDMSQRPFGRIFIGLFNYSNDCMAYGRELVFANTILFEGGKANISNRKTDYK
jgi:hypothetical protein